MLHAIFYLWQMSICIIVHMVSSKHAITVWYLQKGCRLKQEARFKQHFNWGIFYLLRSLQAVCRENDTAIWASVHWDVCAAKLLILMPLVFSWGLNKSKYDMRRTRVFGFKTKTEQKKQKSKKKFASMFTFIQFVQFQELFTPITQWSDWGIIFIHSF